MFKQIRKRNSQIAPFKIEKITNAVYRASIAIGEENWQLAENLTKEVLNQLKRKIKKGVIPQIEEVQDAVEKILIETGHARMAKSYILYRQHRAEIRKEKEQVLNKEEVDEVDKKFDINALRVLASRYLKKDEDGKIIESPKQLFERVATHTAIPSIFYDSKIYKKAGGNPERRFEEFNPTKFIGKFSIGKYKLNQFHLEGIKRVYDRLAKEKKIKVSWQNFLELLKKGYFNKYESEIDAYYNLMVERRFMPNTPALANFGNHFGMGSACFVLGIEDSIKSIMDTLKAAATIFKSGGGVGYNFAHLRPENDFIKTTGGTSSGPISFMSMFDNMTDVIKQGGIRRGANMGILNSDHPDIDKFIKAKEGNKALRNFNISIMVKPEFWQCLKENKPYPLINPRTGKIEKEIDAKQLFDIIAYQVWESAEPGILFYDRINEYNPFTKHLGPIECTNPCVVGDTLVATADGRNYVPIKQLAEEKKDIPVYCYGDGQVRIRMGRMPRKTRNNVPVWKVVLDDSSHIIATEDHKFRDRHNQEIKLKDLKPGVSLMPFYKFQYKPIKKRSPYWGVNLNNGERAVAEHRLIMEFYSGKRLKNYPIEIIHHQCNLSGDLRSTFGGYTNFKEEIELYNHKVSSVEFYGYEDVYNITVDDFHTVAYITNPSATTKSSKKPLLSGIITSQCGEVLLYPFESCNLGSINVWGYLKKNGGKKPHFDWQTLERDIRTATRFLDGVVDINKYPLPEIEAMSLNTRKLGLGVMGVGDLFFELEISYGSKQCLEFMERLMEFINYHAKLTSIELSKGRGRMPYFDKSFYKEGKLPFAGFKDKKSWHFDWNEIAKKIKKYGIRNAFNTVIAPTGSISMIAGTSSGIEPIFSLVFEKSVAIGNFYYVDPVFEERMRKEGLMDEDLIKDAAALNGSIKQIPYIPEKLKKIFITAMDISPVDHIKVLAAFQKWTDSSISKTNNFPSDASVDDIKKAYLLAYELGCKGVTVYRDKSLKQQVLIGGSTKKKHAETSKLAALKDEKAKGLAVYSEAASNPGASLGLSPAEENSKSNNGMKNCPSCKIPLTKQEGCIKCPTCGWGLCG